MDTRLWPAPARRNRRTTEIRLRRRGYELALPHPGAQPGPAVEPKLAKRVVDVRLDGAHREVELLRDYGQ